VERLSLALLTAFGLGMSPVAPGTVGTLLGVAQFAALAALGAEWALAPLGAVWFVVTWRLAPVAVRRWGGEDPKMVVSDEVSGYLLAVALTAGTGLGPVTRGALGFALFRLFDIWKPGPVRWAERLHGGLGIAADDAVAGVLANLAIQGLALAIAGGGW
jgi:phosphatidylglycerophosphatase A